LGRSARRWLKSGRGIDKGGSRPAEGKMLNKIEKIEKLSSARRIYLEKKPNAPNPTGATDVKSGIYEKSEVSGVKDSCGAAGMQQLNILPIKFKAFLFEMCIFTASVFLSNEVGELATTCQA
jgi:hypothetical protein